MQDIELWKLYLIVNSDRSVHPSMKCLWLTRKFPRPGNSGELIYSDGLIRSFATTGVDLTVVAHDNDECPVGDGSASSEFVDAENVRWLLGTPTLGGRAASLLSRYPGDSWRLKNGGPEKLLRRELASTDWEAVIIDHAAIGWALDLLKRLTSSPGSTPFLVYVSHNHEARVRRAVARDAAGPLPKRLALRYDAEKYARQEESLCRSVDLVTAIAASSVRLKATTWGHSIPVSPWTCPGRRPPSSRPRDSPHPHDASRL